MVVGDDMREEFASSLGTNSVDLRQDGTTISPEDVAWADSCLTKDPEEFDGGWNSMKEALLDTLNPQHDASTVLEDKISKASRMEISSSAEETNNNGNLIETDIITRASGDQSTDINDGFWSRYDAKDVFLPTYDENLRDLGASDPEMDLFVPAFQLHSSTEDNIFRIWDLDFPPVEDDGLIKQLNKALAEPPSQPTASVSDHAVALEGLGNESVDDLISGIAELSLTPNQG